MQAHQSAFSIAAMSRVLRVSRSGYYAWVNGQRHVPSPREQNRRERDARILELFHAKKQLESPRESKRQFGLS